MSLITRGFGASASLVTSGFGPPPTTTTAELKPVRQQLHGRRSPERKEELRKHIQAIEVYTITAKLLLVNNKAPARPILERVRGAVDQRDEFNIKTKGKVRIIKTTPISNIFISISQVFKK
tara:strand:+ start:2515 stop:2877 length:363 start_codon:yes stop_codon:yes gene_type:complete